VNELTEVDLTDIARAWTELTGTTPPENLLAEYYPRLSPSEKRRVGPAALARIAAAHWELACAEEGEEVRIAIRNPAHDAVDYTGSRTFIDIVLADVRHAVSTVVAELTRQGLAIREVHHPIMAVRRTESGLSVLPDSQLERVSTDTSVLPVIAPGREADGGPGPVSESWIHVEADRVPEEDFPALTQALTEALELARAADADRERMQARAEEIAAELRAHAPRPELAAEAAEAADLLEWLGKGFVFLGFREYRLVTDGEDRSLEPVPGTDLGISSLRRASTSHLTQAVADKAEEPHVLVLTEANSRSRVMRRGYMDYVGVKRFDETGAIVGERRFVGLWTNRLYSASALEVPVIREKVGSVLRSSGLAKDTHAGDELLGVLESYPRDDLFYASTEEVRATAMAVIDLQEKHEARVFLRRDPYQRYVSVLVYLPKDVYDTAARKRVQKVLREYYSASEVDYDVLLTDSALARLHFTARVPRDAQLPEIDEAEVESRIVAALRSWNEDLWEILAPAAEKSPLSSAERARRWAEAFPGAYKATHTPARAVADSEQLERLGAGSAPVVEVRPRGDSEVLLVLYSAVPVTLTTALPYLANLGAELLDEKPFEVRPAGQDSVWIYEFGLAFPAMPGPEVLASLRDGFAAAWAGLRETDGLDRLLLSGLRWQEVSLVQSFAKYLRQAGFTYSDASIAEVFTSVPELTRDLLEVFAVKFDPDRSFPTLQARAEAAQEAASALERRLADVPSLEVDRVLRSALEMVGAAVRTNFYQPADGSLPEAVVIKLRSTELDFLPKPRPALEAWVHSPRVEGVHLRFGTVARGGLRWSDRRDDFRTEVLGLVKAQMVKNALIVPTGAKGGFFPKRLPDPALDREGWAAEGQAAYEVFISSLLDVSDNLEYSSDLTETVVRPERVVAHDGDDHYLVVAADKGTARFSDVANGIAERRGFWLGDAFASGGSTGYDHKKMAITSRGAWKSVERHLRELGIDAANDDFTAVGIGDMSGDVFGNGMLRSRHIRLVAAFDHRDVFLDPDPDAAVGFAERQRLFDLPRSSWQDYDRSLISAGGGVFSRREKAIEVSPQAAAALGMPAGPHTPDQVISAILAAPVDLLYNGGIGTYVKSREESHAAVGDRANDAIRINGADIRARVVGEGGNLGATQLGRIEAALHGVRLNTDAVDNSAGVDSSDHEVNIKLLLAALIRAGEFAESERVDVLESMTDEVADRVLANNYFQNLALGEARESSLVMTETFLRLLRYLEREADLDRAVEFLPSAEELRERAETGTGLTSPELAVLLAYVKMDAAAKMLESRVPDEPWTAGPLADYFPPSLEPYAGHFAEHPLRREISTARIVNAVVDRGGLTYLFRLQEETGAALPHLVRVFTVVSEVYGLDAHLDAICALDNVVATEVQNRMLASAHRLLDRASRWLVHQSPETLDVDAGIQTYRGVLARLRPQLTEFLRGESREAYDAAKAEYVALGVPEDLAGRSAGLLEEFSLLDIAQTAARTGEDPAEAARVYHAVSDMVSGSRLLMLIRGLDRSSRWTALARGALRDDFYQALMSITIAVLEDTEPGGGAARVDAWRAHASAVLDKVLDMIAELGELDHVDQAPLSVLLRQMRGIVRSAEFSRETE
jgi:glutamate dehydrogenase